MNLTSFELTTWLSLLGMALGLYLTYRAQRKASKKEAEAASVERRRDAENAAAANATLLAEVKVTRESVHSMREEFKDITGRLCQQGERIAIVETKVDRAHYRMDRLEERIDKREE